MSTDKSWMDLDQRERVFCTDNSLKPDEYLKIKRQIVVENAKNIAITQSFVKEKSKALRDFRDKVPLLFDFWVTVGVIPKK